MASDVLRNGGVIIFPTLPVKDSIASRERVMEGFPEILAEGAEIGVLEILRSSFAISFDGILTPIVDSPVEKIESSFFSKIKVIGPGVSLEIES